MERQLAQRPTFSILFVTTILLLVQLFSSHTSFANKLSNCNSDVTIKKINGVKTLVLEKPLDKHLIKMGDESYHLMINKKYELILAGKHTQTLVTSLKYKDDRPAYFIEIDWVGDSNKDCKPDLLLWKKLGIYLGTKKGVALQNHEDQGQDEKIQMMSQPSLKEPYIVQSLGKY